MSPPVRVGLVRRAVGLGGEIEVEPLTDSLERFRNGLALRVAGAELRVERVRAGAHGITLKLSGVDDRTRADRLRGRYLEVDATAAEQLPEGRYYHWQLVGLEVLTVDGGRLGRVVDVQTYPANDVYVVRDGAHETLVPALRQVVHAIDLEAGRMTVEMPPEEELR